MFFEIKEEKRLSDKLTTYQQKEKKSIKRELLS